MVNVLCLDRLSASERVSCHCYQGTATPGAETQYLTLRCSWGKAQRSAKAALGHYDTSGRCDAGARLAQSTRCLLEANQNSANSCANSHQELLPGIRPGASVLSLALLCIGVHHQFKRLEGTRAGVPVVDTRNVKAADVPLGSAIVRKEAITLGGP